MMSTIKWATRLASPRGRQTASGGPRFIKRPHLAVKLKLINLPQPLAHCRAGRKPHLKQVAAQEQRRRRLMLDAESPRPLDEPVGGLHGAIISRSSRGTGQPAGFDEAIKQIDLDMSRKAAKVAIGRLLAAAKELAG